MPTTVQMMIGSVIRGEVDGELEALFEAVRDRRAAMNAQTNLEAFHTFKTGSKVRLVERVKPKIYRGLTGVVVRKVRKNIEIQLDNPPNGHGIIRATPSMMELLDN